MELERVRAGAVVGLTTQWSFGREMVSGNR
eukprot:COSAG01_NODE_21308_length_908_cov_0.684796_1_plen_29_part_01